MISFKQFLTEHDPLNGVSLLMAIRKELKLSDNLLAQEVLDWLRYDPVKTEEAEAAVIRVLCIRFRKELEAHRSSNSKTRDHELLIQHWMENLLHRKYKLNINESQEHDPLNGVSLLMAIRKEFDVDGVLAADILSWLRNDDVDDDTEVFNTLTGYWGTRLEAEQTQHHVADRYLRQWTTQLLKNNYKLELNESQEEHFSLLSGIISNLLKKGEKVAVWAEIYADSDPASVKQAKPRMCKIYRITDSRIYIKTGTNSFTWFELNGETGKFDCDSKLYFQKEGDTWVLAEKNRKPIKA